MRKEVEDVLPERRGRKRGREGKGKEGGQGEDIGAAAGARREDEGRGRKGKDAEGGGGGVKAGPSVRDSVKAPHRQAVEGGGVVTTACSAIKRV